MKSPLYVDPAFSVNSTSQIRVTTFPRRVSRCPPSTTSRTFASSSTYYPVVAALMRGTALIWLSLAAMTASPKAAAWAWNHQPVVVAGRPLEFSADPTSSARARSSLCPFRPAATTRTSWALRAGAEKSSGGFGGGGGFGKKKGGAAAAGKKKASGGAAGSSSAGSSASAASSSSTLAALKPKQQWDRFLVDLKGRPKFTVGVRSAPDGEWRAVGRVRFQDDVSPDVAVARQRALIAEHAKRLYPLQITPKDRLEWGYHKTDRAGDSMDDNDNSAADWMAVDKSVLDGAELKGLDRKVGFEGTPDPNTGYYCYYNEGRLVSGDGGGSDGGAVAANSKPRKMR